MLLSIIIPVLNEEKLLPQLLRQLNLPELRKLFDYEIIISDGGSVDKSIEIALQYADKVIVKESGKKENIAVGRNKGAEHASGELLLFINADIYFENPVDFFLFIKNEFFHSQYSAMTCTVEVFPELQILSDKLYHGFYNNYFYFLNKIKIGMGRGECQLLRREVFSAMNGYNVEFAAGEDFDLFRRIARHYKILFKKDFRVFESPRRYRKYGYIHITLSWFKNSVSIFLRGRAISKIWEEVR